MQLTSTATSLSLGNYLVTVVDINDCDTSVTVTIAEPALLTDSISSVVNVSCNGACNGEATVSVSGGTQGYNYIWNTTPFQSTPVATGLCPGNFTVTVVDTNGFDTTANVTITEPPLLKGSISSVKH